MRRARERQTFAAWCTMKSVILIPARYASTRYPGKPLARLTQPDGSQKSLIQMSWEAASKVNGVSDIFVATDDDRIAAHAQEIGAQVVMTSPECRNGTERCAQGLEKLGEAYDCVINFQGDAPLTPPWFVESLLDEMRADAAVQMATPVVQVDPQTYRMFRDDRRADRVGGTTAVFNTHRDALYFSKEVLPWLDEAKLDAANIPVWHHVGVYAYRPEALQSYIAWGESSLERLEGLEQLRYLYNGTPVRCVPVETRGRVFWELNNPEDVARIESVLKEG